MFGMRKKRLTFIAKREELSTEEYNALADFTKRTGVIIILDNKYEYKDGEKNEITRH